MRVSHPSHEAILQQVGLFQLNEYNANEFAGYISASYLNSDTEARDEVHRMHERILLHKISGLRIAYLVEESYFDDDVEYLVIDCFVITYQGEKVSVKAIDLKNKQFESDIGSLPFGAVRHTREEED